MFAAGIVIGAALAAEPGLEAAGVHTGPLDGDVRDGLFVQRPGPMTAGDAFLGALAQGAVHDGTYVRRLAAATLSAGAVLHPSMRVDVNAPVILVNDDGVGVWGPALGDVRLRTLVNLVSPDDVVSGGGGPGLGLVGTLDLPTGPTWQQLGWGAPTAGAKLAATWEGRLFNLAADAGVARRTQPEIASEHGGWHVLGGLDAAVVFSDLTAVHLESTLRQPVSGPLAADLTLSARFPDVFAGATLGLTNTPGTPALRVFVGGTFTTRTRSVLDDIDSEGRLTILDQCPTERETHNGYKDDDGCPDTLGSLSVDVRWQSRSMPATVVLRSGAVERTVDVPASGLIVDAVPGDVWAAEATAECLAGAASTVAREEGAVLTLVLQPDRPRKVRLQVVDANDTPVDAEAFFETEAAPACVPNGANTLRATGTSVKLGPGSHTVTVTARGRGSVTAAIPADATDVRLTLVPDAVRVEAGQLRTNHPITFDGERLEAASFAPLDDLAAYLLTHPGSVVIGGHTDNSASEPLQLRLSRTRAQVIRDYLVGKGVPAQRLQSIGYGPTRPIDTNRTPTGRKRNERVEFVLQETP